MWYVYVLQSQKDGKLYTGSTNDLKKRLNDHNNGQVGSTKHRRPFKIVYYEAGLSGHKARIREQYLKSAWGKRYLKNRV